MKKVLTLVIAAALLGSVSIIPAFGAVKAGATCSKAGVISNSGGKKFTCVKSGKKLVWNKGVVMTSSTPSQAPSAAPSGQPEEIPEVSLASDFISTSECKLNKAGNNPDLYTGFPRDRKYVPATGDRKSIVLFVDFPDLPSDQRAITVWKQTQVPWAEKAFAAMSFGKYKIKYELQEKFYRLSTNYGAYIKNEAGNAPGSKPAQAIETNKLLTDAIVAADPDIDFSKYDFVNVVTPTFKPKTEGGASGGQGFNADGRTSFLATLGPIDEYLDDPTKKNWLLHETGHLLGLNHIYAGARGPAGWDVMGNVFGMDDFLGFNKFFLGWIEENQVNCISSSSSQESIHLLTPVGTASAGTKLAMIKISQSIAVVIELRRKTELDNLSDSNSGVIVYTLDTSIPDNQGAINIVSNPKKFGSDTRGNRVLLGSMGVGESTITNGFKIKVIKSVTAGSYVSISKAN